MRTSDIVLTIFILLVFIGLYMTNVLAIGIQNIKKNWPKYRCNPIFMPFASMVGPDGVNTSSNFMYCIQNMQTNYMQYLLKPVNYNLNAMGSVALSLSDSINNIRKMFDYVRTQMIDIIQNVFGVFLNLVIEFQRNVINIKDLFGKIVGIIATFVYLLSGSVMSMQSAWAGPPGKIVRKISEIKVPRCFDPDTIIQTQDERHIRMEDLKLGELLKDGTEVIAVMKINNLDKDKHPIHPLYTIKGAGEQERDILVSGTHLIYDTKILEFINVKDYHKAKKTDLYCDYFCCLITSSHIIPIGSHIFHDWEDNQGSKSKDF